MLGKLLTVTLLLGISLGCATAPNLDEPAFEVEALDLLQRYLRVDTTNPPGNETRAVEFLAQVLDAEGIPYETIESASGRGNIWARLEGGGEPGLILLHHTDVVPADPQYWDQPPLSGALSDGYVYGRGALDMKGAGIEHLVVFLMLHRSGVKLRRDVVFMASADEEAGGAFGAGWLVDHRPAAFKDIGFLLTEGGSGTSYDQHDFFTIQVSNKRPFWLRLRAQGKPGHGSSPRGNSAADQLVRALARIEQHEFSPHIAADVDQFFKAFSVLFEGRWREKLSNMREAVKDRAFMKELRDFKPSYYARTRNTCSITRFSSSNKVNVIAPEASAELDCRLLPSQEPEAFITELKRIMAEDIDVEVTMTFESPVSRVGTELYQAIETVVSRHYPRATITPVMSSGFTDSHYFRDIGINSYGFHPILLPAAEIESVHGNNERIHIDAFYQSVRLLREIVAEMVELRD